MDSCAGQRHRLGSCLGGAADSVQTRPSRYSRRGQLSPDYVCQREGIEHAEPICQHIPGSNIDEAVGNLLVETVTPVTLEVALAVQQELQSRLEEADRLRQ